MASGMAASSGGVTGGLLSDPHRSHTDASATATTANGDSLHSDNSEEETHRSADDLDLPRVAVSRGSESSFFRLFRLPQPILRSRRHRADQRPRVRRYNLLSRDKLKVPMRNSAGHYLNEQGRPLVDVGSDDNNEDEDLTFYDSHTMRRLTNTEIREQLLRDGYNLDSQETDADDLDLVPPRPIEERGFYCCNYHISCQIL